MCNGWSEFLNCSVFDFLLMSTKLLQISFRSLNINVLYYFSTS